MVHVEHNDQSAELPLLVVAGSGPPLLGRNWLQKIKLNWPQLYSLHNIQATTQSTVVGKHKPLFGTDLGKLQNYQGHLSINPDSQPRFCKARPVPLAYKDRVAAELNRLENAGIIERVTFSQWAAPWFQWTKDQVRCAFVVTTKLRLIQSLSLTVTPYGVSRSYLQSCRGGKDFTTLDLSQAYHQIELDEESRDLTTINTPLGLFRYVRCPYGISTAPSMFQRIMDTLLVDIPHCAALEKVYFKSQILVHEYWTILDHFCVPVL